MISAQELLREIGKIKTPGLTIASHEHKRWISLRWGELAIGEYGRQFPNRGNVHPQNLAAPCQKLESLEPTKPQIGKL